ncbi:MAG: phosphate ABC transporter permease PstA [Planctomycetaceae bacterium]|nr:phosphate ABC transporter permease PstA [Planctomycetaceae bacterium]
MNQTPSEFDSRLSTRHRNSKLFELFCLTAVLTSLIILAVLLLSVIYKSWGWVDLDFLRNHHSRKPEDAGINAAFWGSFWLIILTALFSIPIGVGAALYLEEYARKNKFTTFIQVNLANLAGVPSIVYGILGLTVFVRMFDMFRAEEDTVLTISLFVTQLSIPLPFGTTLISGALTLSLLILPVVIISSQESLRSVPPSLRHASLALGATEWQTVRSQVLPAAIPGIATGVILSLSRAIGETAPLLMVGAASFITFTPGGIEGIGDVIANPASLLEVPFSKYTCMPMQIYNWVKFAKIEFQEYVASAGIVILLGVLLLMNATAVYIRMRFQNKIQW